jgi:outer membrane receptor protein involved in Fe transport
MTRWDESRSIAEDRGSLVHRCGGLPLVLSMVLAAAAGAQAPAPGAREEDPRATSIGASPERSSASTPAATTAATATDNAAEPTGDEQPSRERVWYDDVTVTAARTDIDRADVPANVTVVDRTHLQTSAALSIDSVLRQVPGFATLREQNSIVAGAQAQAVSMRGLGGSNTSRTLVLLDGIPMNDPYGGWVYWVKAPREFLDKVEVVRGGGSGIWGNLSLGGVVNLLTVEPSERAFTGTALAGEHGTSDLTLGATDAREQWSGWLSANHFDTDGYQVVRDDLQGPLDEPTAKRHTTILGKGMLAPSPRLSLRLSGDWWDEDRERGTPLDRGSADAWSGVGSASYASAAGAWEAQVFSRRQDWVSFATRVSLDRASEVPSSFIFDQPSEVLGASLVRSQSIGDRHRLVAGADGQWLAIEHHQDLGFRSGRFADREDVEGRQRLAGAFVQDVLTPSPRWSVQAGARADHIRNHDGRSVASDIATGAVTSVRVFPDDSETTVNPSLGAVFAATDEVSLRLSSYTGFRAPTPSELYKGFRAGGNAVTEANPELDPERLRGAEVGIDYRRAARFFGRATAFWNELEDLILQTTVGVAGPAGSTIAPCGFVGPRGVCRQRNNVGRARAAGVELEGEFRPSARFSLALSGIFEETEVTRAPELPELVGKRIPQAAEEQLVARVRFSDPALLDALLVGRYLGERYEDDVNQLLVEDLVVVDLTLSRRLTGAASVFAGVENLLDREYEVRRDTTGVVLVARRTAHAGVRFSYR